MIRTSIRVYGGALLTEAITCLLSVGNPLPSKRIPMNPGCVLSTWPPPSGLKGGNCLIPAAQVLSFSWTALCLLPGCRNEPVS